MIADCSLHAKVAMLHGLLEGYLKTDLDDLARNLAGDIQDAAPACDNDNLNFSQSWLDDKITDNEYLLLLTNFLESEHAFCDYQDCRADPIGPDTSPATLLTQTNESPKFEDGQIINPNDCYGFYVLPLATCAMQSAWDFPSFVGGVLGLGHLWPEIECVMHPSRDDATILADAMDFEDPACREKFINEFPLEWDT